MIVKHFSEGKEISGDTEIWRYRSFRRFKQLIKSGSLHFHRIDDFKDPFEGSIPKLVDDIRERNTSEKGARVDKVLNKRIRQHTFANCWHMKDRESANMWDSYGGDKNAIAIKSTIRQLEDAIKEQSGNNLQFADIRYVDFIDTTNKELNKKVPSGNTPAQWTIIKRASFKEENEFRAFIQPIPALDKREFSDIEHNLVAGDIKEKEQVGFAKRSGYLDLRSSPPTYGHNLNVDPTVLLDEIFVDPDAEEEYVQMVKYTSDNFGIDPDIVKHSDLSSNVIY